MPDKLKEFVRETIDELVRTMPPEELLKKVSAEDRLKGLTAADVAKALSPEMRDALLRQLTANRSESQ